MAESLLEPFDQINLASNESSKLYDFNNFKPLYSTVLLVNKSQNQVSQSFVKYPQFKTFIKAMEHINVTKSKKRRKFTIILTEGTYQDEIILGCTGSIDLDDIAKDFALEVVGLGSVFILSKGYDIYATDFNLVMRNVNLIDKFPKSPWWFPKFLQSKHCGLVCALGNFTTEFHHVTFQSSEAPCLIAINGANVVLNNCKLIDSYEALLVNNGASVTLNDCSIERMSNTIGSCESSEIRAEGTKFISCRRLGIQDGKASFVDCDFFMDSDPKQLYLDENKGACLKTNALCAKDGCELTVKRSSFKGFLSAVYAEAAKCFVHACHFENNNSALEIWYNSDFELLDSKILSCRYFLEMFFNRKGKARIERNIIPFRLALFDHAGMGKNTKIKGDIAPYICEYIELDFPTDKDKSEYTAERKDISGEDVDVGDRPWLYKRCGNNKCAKSQKHEESQDPDKKFKWCSRCHKVCYCSAKCQKLDWKKHKLFCDYTLSEKLDVE